MAVDDKKMAVRIILPAYNEERSLPTLLKNLESVVSELKMNAEILVVNDGSTDDTAEIVKRYQKDSAVKTRLINLQPNRGLAEAIRTGIFTIVPECDDEDIIIMMDADNTHTPDLIYRMVRLIRGGCDVVIASRYQKGARIMGLSTLRKLLSWSASIFFRLVVGMASVRDYTCGYRAYRAGLLKTALDHYKKGFIKQSGFACMAEILLKLKRFNPIIEEVPLILRYDYKEGASKMKVWKTTKESLGMLFNYVLKKDF